MIERELYQNLFLLARRQQHYLPLTYICATLEDNIAQELLSK